MILMFLIFYAASAFGVALVANSEFKTKKGETWTLRIWLEKQVDHIDGIMLWTIALIPFFNTWVFIRILRGMIRLKLSK